MHHLGGVHSEFMAQQHNPLAKLESASRDQPPPTNKRYDKDSREYAERLKALCLFLARDLRPLNLVEGAGFHEFVRKGLEKAFPMLADARFSKNPMLDYRFGPRCSMLAD